MPLKVNYNGASAKVKAWPINYQGARALVKIGNVNVQGARSRFFSSEPDYSVSIITSGSIYNDGNGHIIVDHKSTRMSSKLTFTFSDPLYLSQLNFVETLDHANAQTISFNFSPIQGSSYVGGSFTNSYSDGRNFNFWLPTTPLRDTPYETPLHGFDIYINESYIATFTITAYLKDGSSFVLHV